MRGDYLDSRRGDGAIELDPFGYDRFSSFDRDPQSPFFCNERWIDLQRIPESGFSRDSPDESVGRRGPLFSALSSGPSQDFQGAMEGGPT